MLCSLPFLRHSSHQPKPDGYCNQFRQPFAPRLSVAKSLITFKRETGGQKMLENWLSVIG